MGDFFDPKSCGMGCDMWEQCDKTNNISLHPCRAAEVLAIRTQLTLLYEKGQDRFLSQDHLLIFKMEETLLQGSPIEMLQWIASVLNALRQAAIEKDGLE
jgi:hypothetical protein